MDGISNTCRFRNIALERLSEHVDVVNTSAPLTLWYRIAYHLFLFGLPISVPDLANTNKKIRELIEKKKYDVVWIDKGITIRPSTLKRIKEKLPEVKIVSFSPDNMMERPWQSLRYLDCLSIYDYHITTKPFIVDWFYQHGAKNVIVVNKSYEKNFHYPRLLNNEDKSKLGADVGFVGSWEKERCDSLLFLAKHGIKVKVFGDGKWTKYAGINDNLTLVPHGLYDEDYAKSFSAFKISLCFLRKRAFDQTTARSIEIPACGGFMLAERTEEHKLLFEEDKEAVFFSSNEELLEKCRYYLTHEDERKVIAKAGRQRCIESDYTNEGMIRRVFEQIFD